MRVCNQARKAKIEMNAELNGMRVCGYLKSSTAGLRAHGRLRLANGGAMAVDHRHAPRLPALSNKR